MDFCYQFLQFGNTKRAGGHNLMVFLDFGDKKKFILPVKNFFVKRFFFFII